MSWVIFSKTSVSKWLFGWLEPIFDLNEPCSAGEEVNWLFGTLPLSFRFFADRGDLTPLWAVFVESVRIRFCGGGIVSPGMLATMPIDVDQVKVGQEITLG
jgi:hypothetical protein